jgi:hypothetical protein
MHFVFELSYNRVGRDLLEDLGDRSLHHLRARLRDVVAATTTTTKAAGCAHTYKHSCVVSDRIVAHSRRRRHVQ